MKVKVRVLRKLGRHLHRPEHETTPPVVGELSIAESRDAELSRTIVCARLTDLLSESGFDLIPALIDAQVIWAVDNKLRVSGIERIEKAAYSQTWSVELVQ
jgi:hypothetical protein